MGAMRAMLIVISMVLMTNQVSANYVLGQGGASCGTWLEARRTRGSDTWVFRAWILGFVSGVNAASQLDFLVEPDANAIFAWFDNYCRQHPLDKLSKASNALIEDLVMRAAAAGTKTK
jgi:hypothetical protein